MRRNKWIQAYKNAPWRRQLQIIGLVSGVVVFVAFVASIYLNITARAATLGRQIQDIQAEKEVLKRDIEDMTIRLAFLTTNEEMEKRAREAGFVLIQAGSVDYLQFDQYAGKAEASLAPVGNSLFNAGPELPRQFTLSLFEWLQESMAKIGFKPNSPAEGWSQ